MKLHFTKKKEWTVCQNVMFIHCGIRQYCAESGRSTDIQLSQGKVKVMVDISIASLWYKKFLFYIQKHFFFHKNNFLGKGGEWVHEIFQKPICFEFSKNIILKHTALKCFHVEIMMEGTEYSFTSPLWNFQQKKSIDFVVCKFKLSCKLLLPRTLSFQ